MAKKKISEKEAIAIADANEAQRQSTPYPMKDRVFNWIVDRYTRNNHKFKFSDLFIWKGAVYVIPEIFGYLVFFAIFLLLAKMSFDRYGDARTIVFFILLGIWRLNMQIKILSKIEKKLD